MRVLLLLLFTASLFIGCGSGGGDTTSPTTPSTRADAPQPNVADDSLRPPKPPSI